MVAIFRIGKTFFIKNGLHKATKVTIKTDEGEFKVGYDALIYFALNELKNQKEDDLRRAEIPDFSEE